METFENVATVISVFMLFATWVGLAALLVVSVREERAGR